ncbi:MAG: response regulator [Blastocatellia bacterium]
MTPQRVRVLLVEDEIHSRVALAELLQLDGFEVITAENGEDGYRKAIWWEPDVIVTDLLMPVLGGLEMACRIRNVRGRIAMAPILALSGNMHEFDLTHRLNSGVNRFVRKPIDDYRSLSDAIRTLVATRRAPVAEV